MTLWNQKGSELLRGNLLVIPIADSLLYIEPFYLQASDSTSKLPELRQVAVATQDQLKTGKTFDEAIGLLFPGTPTRQAVAAEQSKSNAQQAAAAGQPSTSAAQAPGQSSPRAEQPSNEIDQLLKQAQQLLSDYERLTAEGRHREAGEKLDQLKQILDQRNRKRAG